MDQPTDITRIALARAQRELADTCHALEAVQHKLARTENLTRALYRALAQVDEARAGDVLAEFDAAAGLERVAAIEMK